MSNLPVIPLSTWAKGKSDEEVSDFLKSFSCKKNKEVQWFLRKLSMRFARLNISATHLVLSEDFERIVAYYTLVCKPLSVMADELGDDSRKSLEEFCRLNEQRQCYDFSAYLIAQLGRNYAQDLTETISGDELMEVILDHLRRMRINLGGNVAFVEYERGNAKLLDYYTRNGFVSMHSKSDSGENDKLAQLFRFID